MSTQTLLEELRRRDVQLDSEGALLHVDAPAKVITQEVRVALAEHKQGLLKLLQWERRRLEEADRRGLVIRWSRVPGWIALHAPTDGSWHEVRAEECLPGIVKTANEHLKKKSGVSNAKVKEVKQLWVWT